jgi:hypothetical protein
MAIQISFEAPDGVVYPNAYVRIGKTIIENPRTAPKNITIEVVVHATKALKQAGKLPVYGPQGFNVDTAIVDPDVVKLNGLYAWLKLQPNFSGGTDV